MSSAITLPALDNTMGALLIGVMIAATLYGVSCAQVFYYYNTFPNDPPHVKALVAATCLFDTAHQALISHTIYTYVITNFANPFELEKLVWSLVAEVIFNGLTAFLVQCFFAYRVYMLSGRNMYLTAFILALILTEFALVMVYAVKGLQMTTFKELTTLKDISMAVNVFAAAPDIAIAAVLCTLLHTSRTGFKNTNTVVNRLIIFSVNTGLLTSICAVLSLIFITTLPSTFIYICFFFALGRLYLNSLLATLNARKGVKKSGSSARDTTGDISLPVVRRNHSVNMHKPNEISIKIDTVKEYARDKDCDSPSKSQLSTPV